MALECEMALESFILFLIYTLEEFFLDFLTEIFKHTERLNFTVNINVATTLVLQLTFYNTCFNPYLSTNLSFYPSIILLYFYVLQFLGTSILSPNTPACKSLTRVQYLFIALLSFE